MRDLQATTAVGTDTVLEHSDVEAFKSSLRGDLLRAGDDGYDAARKIWNGMINKTPALIARCTGVADVISAVNFARTKNLLVAVRGGGHNIAGSAVCDGGLVIDVSRMKGIRVDSAKRTARAQAGLTWGEFDRETQVFGLATTGGVVSTTGIAGLTLGGGTGWLIRKYGLTCDNLLSVDLVTADGRSMTASATENPDLFWGLRGGSGNFGVATSFEYQLHPIGQVLAGMVLHPMSKAKEVLEFFREYTSTAPEELTTYCFMLTTPDGNRVIAIVVCYSGPIEGGERVVQPLRKYGPPLADLISPMTYGAVNSMFDAAFPSGGLNYWKANFMREVNDNAIDTIVAHLSGMSSAQSLVGIEHIGSAAVRSVGLDETAFCHRDVTYDFVILAQWSDPVASKDQIQWARTFHEAMKPFYAPGVYVNVLTNDEGEERVRAAYGVNYDRLVALKNKYDPTNFFRLNQNIRPTV